MATSTPPSSNPDGDARSAGKTRRGSAAGTRPAPKPRSKPAARPPSSPADPVAEPAGAPLAAGGQPGGERLSDEERQRRIAEAAYRKAEERGFGGDRQLDDWLEAEREHNNSSHGKDRSDLR